jgi:hypothetical protein
VTSGLCACRGQAFAISEVEEMSRRAAALLTDISRILPKLLPQQQCVALMAMPSLVTMCDAQGTSPHAERRVWVGTDLLGWACHRKGRIAHLPGMLEVLRMILCTARRWWCGAGGPGRSSAVRLLALRASDLVSRLGETREPNDGEAETQRQSANGGELSAPDSTVGYALAVMREVSRICHPVEAEGEPGLPRAFGQGLD